MKPLSVLQIEDSEDDALLVLRELEKGDYVITTKRIETAEQMVEAFTDREWDLILADYTVPGFGAVPALALVKETGLDIPFIIVTGTIDEETAVSAMKAGANDYVMKDKLKRLVPAVERELREAVTRREHKKAESEVGRVAAKLTTIIEMLPDIFYIKDLEGRYQTVNAAFEKFFGRSRTELIGQSDREILPAEIIEQVHQLDREIIASKMPCCYEQRMTYGERTVYLDTSKVPLTDVTGAAIGIVGFARNITEKKMIELELEKRVSQLQLAWEQTISVLSDAVEIRDAYTSGHQKRVANLSVAIGRELGLSKDILTGLEMAAFIHDIGKMWIPGEILSKPGKLSEKEFALIKDHPESGYQILKNVELPWNIAQIIYQHHERLDGSGYPCGLKGDDILIEAKIIAVADVVEAMSAHRPYRPALGIDKALAEIESNRGKLYDPAVVEACLSLFRRKSFSFITENI